MSLKRYMEDNAISVQTEDEAVALVSNYYGRSKAAYAYTELPKITSPKNRPQLRCELVLEFGKYRILVETRLVKASETPNLFGKQEKRHRGTGESMVRQSVFQDLVDEVYGVLGPLDLTQGAIIVFVDHDSEMPPDDRFTLVRVSRGFEWGFWNSQRRALTELELVQKYHDGRVHAVVVNIHRQPSAEGVAIN